MMEGDIPVTFSLPEQIEGEVRAILTAPNDSRVAVADVSRRVVVWNLASPNKAERIFSLKEGSATALAFHPKHPLLVIAHQLTSSSGNRGRIMSVNIADSGAAPKFCIDVRHPIAVLAFSPMGDQIAWATREGNKLQLAKWGAEGLRDARQTAVSTPYDARLGLENGQHYLEITLGAGSQAIAWRLETRELLPRPAFPPPRPAALPQLPTYDASRHGAIRAADEITFADGTKWIAVGMSLSHEILLFDVSQKAPVLLRNYWGHTDQIRSLRFSADGRYLVSSSADGTARIWSLISATSKEFFARVWGANLESTGGRLILKEVDEAGPLFFKGLRAGDQIHKVYYPHPQNPTQDVIAKDPDGILTLLASAPQGTVVTFETQRDGVHRPLFQTLAGWQHLLALYIENREWIAWNSLGYYSCSANGERLMGWQLNDQEPAKDLTKLIPASPEFFEAAKFHAAFFRPEAIDRLLSQGSISRALGATQNKPRMPPTQIAEELPPKVWVEAPDLASPIEYGRPVRITLHASSRSSHPITHIVPTINGRPAGVPKEIRPALEVVTEATLQLPPNTKDKLARVEVGAFATTSAAVGESKISLLTKPTVHKPLLRVLAIGISQYKDSSVGNLKFAHFDARALQTVLREKVDKQDYSDAVVTVLPNELATREAITEALGKLMDNLGPGDSAVVFYSGHGRRSEGNFVFVPHDAIADSSGDLDPDSLIPIRAFKEAFTNARYGNRICLIVDACHAGEIDQMDLWAHQDTVRDLNRGAYRVKVLLSCSASQKSQEDAILKRGKFSALLMEALGGRAANAEGRIGTLEAGRYIEDHLHKITDDAQHAIVFGVGNLLEFGLTEAGGRLADSNP
jgi:hypothetical protein